MATDRLAGDGSKTAVQLVAHGQGLLRVRSRGLRVGRHPDLADLSCPAPAGSAVGEADQDPVQPRVELLRFAQGAKAAPRSDQRVLHHVRRQLVITQDQPGSGVQALGAGSSQRREGIHVARLCADHQVVFHRWPLSWQPDGCARLV